MSTKNNTLEQAHKKFDLKSFFTGVNISKFTIAIILFAIIVIPLIRMIFYMTPDAIKSVFSSDSFYKALLNSFLSTLTATAISIVLAYALAWAITRTNVKCKYLLTILITLPMLIPSISHGMGLIILFGNNGIITRLFNSTNTIYGFWGVVIGSVLYSFPVAFIMFADVLKYEDQTPYEAADVLGISKTRQFTAITFPYLKKPLISIVFAVFTMIFTDYGVAQAVGGSRFPTLAVMLFNYATATQYEIPSVYGFVLLLPAVAAFLFDLFNKDKGNSSYISREYNEKSWKKDTFGYIITILTSLFVALVVFSFCIQAFAKSYPRDTSFTFDNFVNTFSNKNGGKFLLNSVIIALLTSLIGVVIGTTTAYLTARVKSKFSRVLHLMSIVSLAIPGLVLGLAYVMVFKKSFVYGTIIILIMVNTVHFFASPYLMIYNAFNKMNENLEEVGSILGISRIRMIKDVIIPQSKYTLIEMFSYFFVNCMMTISAVSFLFTEENRPIALMINRFEDMNMMECAAVVAIVILVVNVLMKGIVYLIRTIGTKYANKKTV